MKHSGFPYSKALVTGALALALAACNKTPTPATNAGGAQPTEATGGADATDGAAEFVSDTAPPPLPVYDQPPIPQDGDIWTPGYWAWNDSAGDYYWTPGTWVQPPGAGLLWTPGYWIFVNARYAFHAGHWGRQVGFYGGIDYGHGYGGQGYQGGRWQGDRFYYNTAVNDIADGSTSNVYRQAVIDRGAGGRASFNGGEGGVSAHATAAELAAAQDPRTPPTLLQEQQARMAQSNPGLRASVNHGVPTIAATSRPAVFEGPGAATGARAAGVGGAREAPAAPTPQARPTAVGAEPARPAGTANPRAPQPPAASHPPPPNVQARPAARPAAPAPRPPVDVELYRDKPRQ